MTIPEALTFILNTMEPGDAFSVPWIKWQVYLICGMMVSGLRPYQIMITRYICDTGRDVKRDYGTDRFKDIWRIG